jgi:soluble lytic murein transglycosylase-like protein
MSPLLRLSAALVMSVSVQPANAQVIEIGQDGETITYDRPTLFVDGVARPLVLVVARAKSPARWVSPGTQPIRSMPFDALLSQAARAEGLAPELLTAVAWQESRGRSDALSPKGAIGVMQLMPGTARAIGVNPHDPAENIMGGARYLRQQIDRFGTIPLALAAYNAGPGAVSRFGGIPPFRETQTYVSAILSRLTKPQPRNRTDAASALAPFPNALLIEVSPS